jgi:hypothetical protein
LPDSDHGGLEAAFRRLLQWITAIRGGPLFLEIVWSSFVARQGLGMPARFKKRLSTNGVPVRLRKEPAMNQHYASEKQSESGSGLPMPGGMSSRLSCAMPFVMLPLFLILSTSAPRLASGSDGGEANPGGFRCRPVDSEAASTPDFKTTVGMACQALACKTAWIEHKKDALALALAPFTILGIVTTGVLVYAAATSCPFIYSHDGREYARDAEPYGGAITRALERTDHDVLDHLRAHGGRYRLKVTNELEETQYTDVINLIAVDHPRGTRGAVDREGVIHTLVDPRPPRSASGPRGASIIEQVRRMDGYFWQTDLDARRSDNPADLRDDLVFEFERPAHARVAKLVVRLSNSPWALHMYKQYLAMLGADGATWLEKAAGNESNRTALKQLVRQQGILDVEVSVMIDGEWKHAAYLAGASPLVPQERVVAIKLGEDKTERLAVRLSAAAGFWLVDAVAIDFEEDRPLTSAVLAPMSAVDHEGRDIAALLKEDDGKATS